MGRWVLLAGAAVVVGIVMWRLVLAPSFETEEALPDASSAPAAEPPRDPGPVANQAAQPGSPETAQARTAENPAAAESPPQAPSAPQEPSEDLVPIPPPEASGPVAELKQAFAKEPRDSAAQLPESQIQGEFRKSDISPTLLKSVLCRKTVCKVETLWSPERAESFMAAFMRLSTDFSSEFGPLALDPHAAPDIRQERQIDVYLPRLDPSAPPAER
jgi:hypothetical protein